MSNAECESNSSSSMSFPCEEPVFLTDDNCIDGGTIASVDEIVEIKQEPGLDIKEYNDDVKLENETNSNKRRRKGRGAKITDETAVEREARLAKMSEYTARRLANESPAQRAKRLQRMSEYSAKRLSSETPEKRAARLARMSAYTAVRLALETPEERSRRLARMSKYAQSKKKPPSFVDDDGQCALVNDTVEVIICSSGES